MLIPLSEFALNNRMGYNRALRLAIRGGVPGVTRLSGKWYVETASTASASVPPEVETLRSVVTTLSAHPFRLIMGGRGCA